MKKSYYQQGEQIFELYKKYMPALDCKNAILEIDKSNPKKNQIICKDIDNSCIYQSLGKDGWHQCPMKK